MSVPERLQQIDQSLIELLGQRIDLLANSYGLDPTHLSSTVKGYLKEANIPESIWTTLSTNCLAAAQCQRGPTKPPATRKVTVVGGYGVMGRFFAQRLTAAGHDVNILDATDWDRAAVLLQGTDLVLLCVPLKVTVETIHRIAPYLSPTTVLADVASIKAPICAAMLEAHQGPVLGLHPMFGPGVTSFMGQKVIACPGRGQRAYQWVLDWIEAEGGYLVTCSPEEHDHMMVMVQAIRHFSTFCLGVFLAEEGVDMKRSLELSTLIYRVEADMIGRFFAQDAELYIEIMLASCERLAAISRLSDTCQRLAQLVAEQNRAALVDEFSTVRQTFHRESGEAMAESNYMLQNLSHFLAAKSFKSMTSCVP